LEVKTLEDISRLSANELVQRINRLYKEVEKKGLSPKEREDKEEEIQKCFTELDKFEPM